MIDAKRIHPVSQPAIPSLKRGRGDLWILAVLPIIAIPFEEQYTILGFSIAKLTIIPLFLGVLLLQPSKLLSVMKSRVFLCGMVFTLWGAVIEYIHPSSDWEFLYRTFQMFILAALIAAVTSDPIVLRRVLYALAFVCSILALYLIYNFYGLVNTEVSGWKEAGSIRDSAFKKSIAMSSGLNIIGYTVGMGAIVALAKFLSSKGTKEKILWSGIYVLCAVGSFVPLSRGSFLALLIASGLVLLRGLGKSLKPGSLIFFAVVAMLIFSLMPQTLTERYTSLNSQEQAVNGKMEGRAKIYTAALDSFPEYWKLGVGTGYYWDHWGVRNGFGRYTNNGPAVLGPHNGLLAAWIYFGLPGMILFISIWVFAAIGCLKADDSVDSIIVFGLLGIGLIWVMFTHSLYLKSFGVILGLLIGASMRTKDLAILQAKRLRMEMAAARARQLDQIRPAAVPGDNRR